MRNRGFKKNLLAQWFSQIRDVLQIPQTGLWKSVCGKKNRARFANSTKSLCGKIIPLCAPWLCQDEFEERVRACRNSDSASADRITGA